MYCRKRHTTTYWVLSPAASLVVFLLVLPVLMLVRVPFVAAQTASPVGPAVSPEVLPLSVAQEQARRLATALTGKSESTGVAEKVPALGIIVEQTRRLGQRTVIRLFVWGNIEVQLVGGEQTFASPVDETFATASEDAGRPVFLPASQTTVAVEVLSK